MPKLFVLIFISVSTYAIEPFQEQMPLQMTAPNINKAQTAKWIPLSSSTKATVTQSTLPSNNGINESIKTLIQKKMQTLLKPLNDEDEH